MAFGFDDVLGAVAGPLISGGLSFIGQQSANEANLDIASGQQAFQERMSSTAHQREVADLKAAGLNPMLSAKYGGSSSPAGATTRIENALGAGVSSGTSAAITQATIANLRETNDKIRAEAMEARSHAFLNENLALQSQAQVPFLRQQEFTSGVQSAYMQSQIRTQNMVRQHFGAQIDQLVEQGHLTRAEARLVDERVTNAVAEREHIKASTGNIKVDTVLKQMNVPDAINRAESASTWWGKNVRPFLHDVGQSAEAARDTRNATRPGYRR